jgi:hypothetical protein
MVLVTVNAQVASLKAKYEYLTSWVRLVTHHMELEKYVGKQWPQGRNVGERRNMAQQPDT